jgi:predicted adenylyl cyclase CyaB
MASNVEIKARVSDWDRVCARAEALAGPAVEILEQEDTFFEAPHGRLKLRQLRPDHGELILYHRADQAGPKVSSYLLSVTPDPMGLRAVLGEALGVRGVVRKRRILHRYGRTRIHLDEVEGLGRFLELEVMLRPDEPSTAGSAEAEELMRELGVARAELISGAYLDLMLAAGT